MIPALEVAEEMIKDLVPGFFKMIFFFFCMGLILFFIGTICKASDTLASNVRFDGFIAQSYIWTSDNQVYDRNFRGFEAGLRAAVNLGDNIEIRGLLKAEPAFKDGTKIEVEYFLADIFTQLNNTTYGIRGGKLFTSWGFHGDTRLNPALRLGVTPTQPLTILWPRKKAIYDNAYGGYIYSDGSLFNLCNYSVGIGYLEHDQPRPTEDYTYGADGSYPEQLTFIPVYMEASIANHRLRVDYLDTTQQNTIPYPATYDWYTTDQLVPIYGKFQGTFDLWLLGYQYYHKLFTFTFENVRMKYKDFTTDVYPLMQMQYNLPERITLSINETVRYYNVMFQVPLLNGIILHVSYGWIDHDKDFQQGYENDWNINNGITWAPDDTWAFKVELFHIEATWPISYAENREEDFVNVWQQFGTSIAYSF